MWRRRRYCRARCCKFGGEGEGLDQVSTQSASFLASARRLFAAHLPDNETPSSRARGSTIYGNEDRGDHKKQSIKEVASNQRPPSANLVDEQDARCLREQGQDAVDGLVLERILATDADLCVDCDAVVLDGLYFLVRADFPIKSNQPNTQTKQDRGGWVLQKHQSFGKPLAQSKRSRGDGRMSYLVIVLSATFAKGLVIR